MGEASSSSETAGANAGALERFRALFRMPQREAAQIIGEHGTSYFREYFDGRVPVDSYVEKARLLMRLTGAAGGSLLDVGCGHGFVVCLADALGAGRAVGIDIHGGKVKEARQLAAYMGCERTEFVEYDGGRLPFADGEFDAVATSAALSHVTDIEATLGEMGRVLRVGGRFYAFEDNNAMHWQYAKRIHPVWKYAETGEGAVSHATARREDGWVPYVERRARMIREWFPELSEQAVAECAERTKGLVRDEIRDAVAKCLESGAPIVVDKPFLVYAPDTGEALEYPFTPPMLREMVAKRFGNARIESAWTGPYLGAKGALKRMVQWAGAMLPPLMWKTQPVFIVTARKEAA